MRNYQIKSPYFEIPNNLPNLVVWNVSVKRGFPEAIFYFSEGKQLCFRVWSLGVSSVMAELGNFLGRDICLFGRKGFC